MTPTQLAEELLHHSAPVPNQGSAASQKARSESLRIPGISNPWIPASLPEAPVFSCFVAKKLQCPDATGSSSTRRPSGGYLPVHNLEAAASPMFELETAATLFLHGVSMLPMADSFSILYMNFSWWNTFPCDAMLVIEAAVSTIRFRSTEGCGSGWLAI